MIVTFSSNKTVQYISDKDEILVWHFLLWAERSIELIQTDYYQTKYVSYIFSFNFRFYLNSCVCLCFLWITFHFLIRYCEGRLMRPSTCMWVRIARYLRDSCSNFDCRRTRSRLLISPGRRGNKRLTK